MAVKVVKKKRGPKKGSGGRPKVSVDWELFGELCKIQCTAPEIAAVLKISPETLNQKCKKKFGETFLETYKKKSVDGFTSLRRAQWKKAVDDENTTMQIWLGKQYLGQAERYNERKDDTPKTEVRGEYL